MVRVANMLLKPLQAYLMAFVRLFEEYEIQDSIGCACVAVIQMGMVLIPILVAAALATM